MKATGCPINVSKEVIENYVTRTWKPLFRHDEYANKIYNKRVSLQDKIDRFEFNRMGEEAYKLMKSLDDNVKKVLVEDVRSIAREISKAIESAEGVNRGYGLSVAGELTRMKKYDSAIIDNIKYIEDLYVKNGYMPYKLFTSMSDKGTVDIYQNTIGSLKYAFLLEEGVTSANLKDWLKNFATTRGLSKKATERFVDDMIGSPLLTGQWGKWIGGMKSMYSTIKYSPITAPVSGSLLLLNNTLLGTSLLLSMRRGLEGTINSDAVDFLLKEEKILASETRAGDITMNFYDQDGKNFWNNTMDKVFGLLPDTKRGGRMRAFLQGGVHNVRDMTAENYVKRIAIAQALAKNGINKSNIGVFLEALKKGEIAPEFLLKLRGDSHLGWSTFFTTGGISSLNRNKFSRLRVFNTLQNYVTTRADDVWSGIKKAQIDFKSGKIRTYGDFADYLMAENQELRGLLNNILLSAKLGIYINAMTDTRPDEDEHKTVFKYITNMSDYLSSLKSTFMYRIFTAPVDGLDKYYKYTAATGQSEEFIDGVSVAFLNMLSETVTQMYREGKILNILTDTALGYLKTGDLDLAKEIAATDFDKIVSGMGRFSLLPGIDSYGQKGIESKDDMIGRIVMDYPEFNEATKQGQRLKDIGTVETILNDNRRAWLNILNNFPIISAFYKGSDKSITGQFSEASWKLLQNEIENNETMKSIWNGELPLEILDNQDIVNNLYSELTSHSYFGKHIGKDGEHIVSEYGYKHPDEKVFTQTEEKVFVQNIVEGLGITFDDLETALKSDAKGAYITKVIAAAEANKPGSSKIILGYLANNDLHLAKQAIYGKSYSSSEVDIEVEDKLKSEIVEKYYPFLYFADKTSWYKLAREYMADYKPEVFQGLATDTKLNGFVNTLAFNDMLFWNEAQQGNVDAEYIKNIFNVSAKYIKDDGLRTKVVTNSLNTINELKGATNSQKQLMRFGVLASNIDHYQKIKNDPIMNIAYKNDIDYFENTIRGTLENLNNVGIDRIEQGMDNLSKKQYYGATGKTWEDSPYSAGNNKVIKQVQDGVNKYYNPAQYGTTPRKTIDLSPYNMHLPQPTKYTLYYKLYNDTYKAVSEDITKQSARRYPAEDIEGMKFNKPSYRKSKSYKSPGTKFSKSKSKSTSQSVKRTLPGG